MRKFRVIGMVISVLIIVSMIVIMINMNFGAKNHSNDLEEYPSGLIEDLPSDLIDENIDTESGLDKNKLAPDFKLTTLTGETVSLSDYKGKTVILNFWASWCPPCRVEMPYMENYYEENKDSENVEILAVNMTKTERGGGDKIGKVQGFVDELELTFPILLDEAGDVMKLYQVMAYPTTYIINPDGIITDVEIRGLDEELIAELVNNSQ
ncbi:peroxiredoxin family protein [Sporosarcina jiandibaonis]|uniref:peroxiredoxin family protein n=1 Tax=Sporosarcina jiandibaonis TaxID=2715535 RepID=UPI0015566000|nr:TlpA disulfide reductase family protein [Sporosarcina jiandibaonis]